MKKIVKYMPLLAIPLVLSSCAFINRLIPGGNSNNSNNSSNSGSSDSITPPSGSWSSEIQSEMTQYLGVVLPYAELDQGTLYHEYIDDYVADEGVGIYAIGDSSPSDTGILNNYGSYLTQMGFTKGTDDYGDECYAKTTSVGDLEVSFAWYEASDTYDAGYEITASIYLGEGGGQGGEGGDASEALEAVVAEINEALEAVVAEINEA